MITEDFSADQISKRVEGGLRTRGYSKKSTSEKPLVSIITVVFNGEDYLEQTIQSVINQTYENIEYIIIDGGSNDNTVNIIHKYDEFIDYWISEEDSGIYDGMNKGISLATGDWFNFLNCSDYFVDNEVLKKIFSLKRENITVLYGDVLILKENNDSYLHKSIILETDKSLKKGMLVCHQAIFYHRGIMQYYDATLRLKAEWKHLISMTRQDNFYPLKLDFPIVYYRLGGESAQQAETNHIEFNKVFLEEYGFMEYIKYKPLFYWWKIKLKIKRLLQKMKIL